MVSTLIQNHMLRFHTRLAEGPGVARIKEKKLKKRKKISFRLAYVTPRLPMSVQKKFSPFGPAVWPASQREHIYECVVLLYR